MESFYMNGKKIIGFLVLVLIFNMIFDTKSTEKFVLIILFSMCILNADKFIEFMKNTFDSEVVTAGTTNTAESYTEKEWQEQNKDSSVNKHYIA